MPNSRDRSRPGRSRRGFLQGLPCPGQKHPGVSTLYDDRYFDSLSGQQAYKCFACRVRKA